MSLEPCPFCGLWVNYDSETDHFASHGCHPASEKLLEARRRTFATKTYIQLFECPFCGSERTDLEHDGPWFAFCHDCDASGPQAESPEEAADKWNRAIRKAFEKGE